MSSAGTSIVHITTAGERWDLLAFRFYGDATKYSPIIMANPFVPIEPVFDAGVTIVVPILPAPEVTQIDLPPWRAQAAAV